MSPYQFYYLQRKESNVVVVVFKRAAWRLLPPGTGLLPTEPAGPAVRLPDLWQRLHGGRGGVRLRAASGKLRGGD